jgi:hypothetical protein
MARKMLLGSRPLTNAEKQARHRERITARLAAAEEAIAFVLRLHPATPNTRLAALQRKLKALPPLRLSGNVAGD